MVYNPDQVEKDDCPTTKEWLATRMEELGIREFVVSEHMTDKKCQVCDKYFQIGEKIVLCPLQQSLHGFINAVAIPLHTKCHLVDKREEDG